MASVIVEVKDYIATVSLCNKPVNVLTNEFYTEIKETFEALSERDDVRVVILRSALKLFCGGGDISVISTIAGNPEDVSAQNAQLIADCVSAIYACKHPVVGAVNGNVIGAGAALAAACDVLLASDDAVFSVPELMVGYIGASEFLQLLLPRRLIRYYYFTGKPIPAQRIYELGGLLDVVPIEQLEDRANKVANDLLRNSPLVLRYAKEALNENDKELLAEKYMNEFRYTYRFAQSADFKEATQAFFEKRRPQYTGR